MRPVRDATGTWTVEEDPARKAEYVAMMIDTIRAERNRRLFECDWTQLADSPLSPGDRDTWKQYRQQLRDLPEQFVSHPGAVTWPDPPGALL